MCLNPAGWPAGGDCKLGPRNFDIFLLEDRLLFRNYRTMSYRLHGIVFCFCLFLGLSPVGARHIIGGVITYECLGNDEYEFTLVMYRDCNCTECAPFDEFAAIGIYRCGENVDCSGLFQGQTFSQINVPLQEQSAIDDPDYPCLIPPDVCAEEGIYRFTVTLPKSAESYHVSYQRCCRNRDITNLNDPLASGATYTIEITSDAQYLCNSSPVFNAFPPTIICADAPLEFDHSATDPDGDQLVYEFCSPLLGGGNITQGATINTCAGAQPIPACPPPYNPVSFARPTYSSLNPMGGRPTVTIDPNTGLITGTPDILGKYVVGVCVEEYRGDTLLSRVFRDFQFNVASCDPTVVAQIQSDQVINDQEYVVNACGIVDVQMVNESFQRQFVDFVRWDFDINGTMESFSDWDPVVTFPGLGQYLGQLILNPDTDCGDTADVVVNVLPAINADFSFDYDTCIAGPVQFTDLSETGAERLAGWQWNFGDGNGSSVPDPEHLYARPGSLPVTLQVRDNNECVDQISKTLPYFPAPSLIVVAPSSFEGCAPGSIFFNNLSTPIDSTYTISWNFGDGGMSNEISPTYLYENDGVYTVDVNIVSPIGCETAETFPDLIRIRPSPSAGFSFSPDEPSNILPTVNFFDESSNASNWRWEFGDLGTSFNRNPTYTFRDTGTFEIRQIVTHPSGCTDTLIQLLDVKPEVRYYLPNAFTPNGDSVNDTYKGVGIMEGATGFRMGIWNRWGELIFETQNPDEAWNGRKFNEGLDSPNGVYVVVVNYFTPRGERVELKGFATLIR